MPTNPKWAAGQVPQPRVLVDPETGTVLGSSAAAPLVVGYASAPAAWQYAAGSGGIADTADVTLAAAPAAGVRNYLVALQIINTDASVGTEVVIKDGATVLWRGFAPASIALVTQPSMVSIVFPQPLKQPTTATALTAAAITTSAQLYVNAQGFAAA